MGRSKNKITLYNIGSTLILQGLTFISGPIFSKILGTGNYGVASVYLTWVQIASTVFSLQAASTIAQAKVYYPEDEQRKYQSSVFTLSGLAYLTFSVVTVIFGFILSRWLNIDMRMVGVGLLHGWGLYCVTAMNSKFTYEFKADKNFILSVSVSVLTIGLSILFIKMLPKDVNYWGRILAQSGIYTIIGTALFIGLVGKEKSFYNEDYWKFTLPISIPTIFHLIAHIILGQSDKVMIKGIMDNSAAGIYALASVFGAVLQTLWNAFNNSWVPFYYEYTKQDQIEEMRKHAKNYLELFTVLAMGFILLSREVFHIYADKAFWEGTDLLPLFSLGYYFVFLYSFPVNYEFYHKKTKTVAVGTCSAAICNIILNVLFIMLWGIQGAVIATAVAHGLQFIFHFICAKSINPGEFPFKMTDFIPGLIAVSAICVLYWFTKDYWLIRWGIGAALGIYILTKVLKRREIF